MARRGALRPWVVALTLASAAASGAALPARAAGDPAEQYQWALSVIGAQAARSVATGAGQVIAVLDTGVDLGHEDLVGKLVPGRNFVDEGAAPQDDNGHGTHVAGTAAAATGNGKGIAGVAPDAKVMPVKILDPQRKTSDTRLAAGIRWAADSGADVLLLAIDEDSQISEADLREACDYAWSKGAVPVVASGSTRILSGGFDAANAIVVAATTRDDADPSTYRSSVGDAKWGMAAPGGADSSDDDQDVLSTYWPHKTSAAVGSQEFGRYAYQAGTSVAAAHVAGAVAVLRSMGLSPQRTVDRLLETARDVGATGRDDTFGAGVLDLAKAVKGLRASTASSTSTTVARAASSSSTTAATSRANTTATPGAVVSPTGPSTSAPEAAVIPASPAVNSGGEDEASGIAAGGDPTDGGGGGGGPAALLLVAVVAAAAGGGGWWWRRRSDVQAPSTPSSTP